MGIVNAGELSKTYLMAKVVRASLLNNPNALSETAIKASCIFSTILPIKELSRTITQGAPPEGKDSYRLNLMKTNLNQLIQMRAQFTDNAPGVGQIDAAIAQYTAKVQELENTIAEAGIAPATAEAEVATEAKNQ